MEMPSYRYRSLADIAASFEAIAQQHTRGRPRNKLDHAFSKGQASAWFAAAQILRKAVIVAEPEPSP